MLLNKQKAPLGAFFYSQPFLATTYPSTKVTPETKAHVNKHSMCINLLILIKNSTKKN